LEEVEKARLSGAMEERQRLRAVLGKVCLQEDILFSGDVETG
jgi:hypothetical protein